MIMEMYSLRRILLFLTILHCLQGVNADCDIPDGSLKIRSVALNRYSIECANSSLVMTVGKIKTFRMNVNNFEIFKCNEEGLTTNIMAQTFSIKDAKCISRVTCNGHTRDGVNIADVERQLRYVGEKGGAQFTEFGDYTAGDQIYLKCAQGYGQPKSTCDEDPSSYDYESYDANGKLPIEGTFTCEYDGKWNSEPNIDCKKIVCSWTGTHEIDNGRLVGLKNYGEYLLGDTIQAVCLEGFKPTEFAVCQPSGCFSKTTVSCREIYCPRLEQYNNFENGHIVYSNQLLTVNSTATFYCDPGYERFGPDVRTCQADGSWSDDECITCQRLEYANQPPTLKTSCPAPCVPYGAIKEGSSYEIGDTVFFQCHDTFHYLVGADKRIARVCLKNAMWNGTDIDCTETKKMVGKLLGQTLEKVVERAEQRQKEWEKNQSDMASERSIDVYNSLQLYLLVDTSGSITNESFENMKKFLIMLLDKVFSSAKDKTGTEVFLRYFGKIESKEFKFTNLSQFQNHNITRDDAKNWTEGDTNIPNALKVVWTNIGTRQLINDRKGYSPSIALIVISDDGRNHTSYTVFYQSGWEFPTCLISLQPEPIFPFALVKHHGQNNMGGDPGQDMINDLHSKADTYSIFVGKPENERSPMEKRGYQLMQTLASTNTKDKSDVHIFSIDNSEASLQDIIEQMTHVKDPIQCGEYSDLTGLNQDENIDRIVNAKEGAWPWMVSLEDGKNHKCGATLLNENWILTAAHCDIKSDWKIYIGRTSRSDKGADFTATSMADTVAHEKYNNTTMQYDLRVVKLANPVLYKREKPFAAPVCLYNATEFTAFMYEDLFKNGSRGVVTGWGKQENNAAAAASDNLKQKQIRIKDDTTCAEKDNNKQYDMNVNFCALGISQDDKVIDACKGDSGGPFVVKVDDSNRKAKFVIIQIGIVSWGKGCYTPDNPGYYVRLTPELIDWINKKISDK